MIALLVIFVLFFVLLTFGKVWSMKLEDERERAVERSSQEPGKLIR